MDIKVNPLTQPIEIADRPQVQNSDEGFKFALISHLQDHDLEAQLSAMVMEISAQGERISKRKDIADMKRYRTLIKTFLNEVLSRSHEFARENFLDRRGRHRVYGIIRKIDDTLDALAAELVKDEMDNLTILSKIGEIRGLLLDIFM